MRVYESLQYSVRGGVETVPLPNLRPQGAKATCDGQIEPTIWNNLWARKLVEKSYIFGLWKALKPQMSEFWAF